MSIPPNKHFNPRPPRGGRRRDCLSGTGRSGISIHAPREGGDERHINGNLWFGDFNPRPPRGGRRKNAEVAYFDLLFQSTPPARGATLDQRPVIIGDGFQSTPPARGATMVRHHYHRSLLISIHAPREGGDAPPVLGAPSGTISIHAPREGGDTVEMERFNTPLTFQSTPPARGATRPRTWLTMWMRISIHAPREGGDSATLVARTLT